MTSGISTMSKEFVVGTVNKYDWVQLGAAIKHPENGKIVNVDDDIRKRTGVKDASLKIIPNNGYGDIRTLRKLIDSENPDAILHFTDPHYWKWLYESEHEIRQRVPILYYHIWDNIPDPLYNRDFYESCDWIGCISKQTYGIVHRVGKLNSSNTFEPLDNTQISYVPHGINSKVFKPIESISDEIRMEVTGGKEYDFILMYNNRNIRRKQPSDVIMAYKLFCDQLTPEQADRCLLFMRTTAVDSNGTDLPVVKNALCPNYNVRFSNTKLEQDSLNEIYNLVDCTINIANNEGFGLATAESIMSGTPIIVTVTGGLQDQCGFDYTADDYISIGSLHDKLKYSNEPHGEWVFPIWPSSSNLTGSVLTPYIFEDRVNLNDVAENIRKVYDLSSEERKHRGLKGREWAMENISSEKMCQTMSLGIDYAIANYKPKKKYNLYKIS